jgi:hypothetical protein
VKLASLTFFLLLLLAHATAASDELLGQPLSVFRDGEQGLLGYAIFAELLLIGTLYVVALGQSDRIEEASIAGLATVFLLVVAATPSYNAFHLVSSALLLLVLLGYYAALLYHAESLWLFAHLSVPLVLAVAIDFHSYGLWQKSLICYFVLLAVIHHHLLLRGRGDLRPALSGRHRRGNGLASKRRKVYLLGPGREWARQKARQTRV